MSPAESTTGAPRPLWPLAAGALAGGAYAWARRGPGSARWRFDRADARPFAAPSRIATTADLDGLPEAAARLLGSAGVVGRPIPAGMRAHVTGRLRSAPDAAWMPFRARQVSTFAPRPTRRFLMQATMRGLPVEVLHQMEGRTATMRAKVLSLIPVITMSGPEADRAEAVTFLNDMCVFAPGALLDAPVTWQGIDAERVRVEYDAQAGRVGAELTISRDGRLVDFVSHDRVQDPGTPRSRRLDWSTPIDEHAVRDGASIGVHGGARWREDGRWWTYLELRIDDLSYATRAPQSRKMSG
ncbi:DUF6544 family protein [Demequina pelophila]|uniref:DUF6544 family protein n=1 Tax=Demequina pelophila TaxID=1638984 RepID=UPI000784727A|nr:DUF6544 family protein [Demequina pelophila]